MRLPAINFSRRVLFPLLFVAQGVVLGQSNICNCPTPPGGQAHCASNQIAFCSVKDGAVVTTCITPPARSSSGHSLREAMQADALSIIFDTNVTADSISENSRYRAILAIEGVRTTNAAVTFSIPNSDSTGSENGKPTIDKLPVAGTEEEKRGLRKFSEFSGFKFPNRWTRSPPPPQP